MPRIVLLLGLFLLNACAVLGQSTTLTDLVTKLQGTFSKVETASLTYEQKIKLVEYSTLDYAYKQTDLKGVETSFSCDFNLADIDPYAVRQETQKDIIFVVLTAKNKQRLFKRIKNGKSEPYDDEIRIHARDIDHARAMLDIIKMAIPLGEKITIGKLKLEGYGNMKKWLEEHVAKVSDGVRVVDQSIREQAFPGSYKLIQVESDGRSAHQEELVFNVADINLNSIVFKISGNSFGLEFGVLDKLKSVSLRRDGEVRPFVDKVVIATNGVDEARDIRTVLTLISPLAQAKVKADMPNPSTAMGALDKLVSLIKEVKVNEVTYLQSMTSMCVTKLTVTEQSAKATTTNTYEFNWMDINPDVASLRTSGEKMVMELPIFDKRNLVSHFKEDELYGFDEDVSILVEDVEVGRRLRFLVDKTINYCKASYKDPLPPSTEGMVKWIKQSITDVTVDKTTVNQLFELAEEGNINKIKLTRTEVKSSSTAQEVFEFNLGDINPNSVNYQITGKWLKVRFETNFKNKIIKAYKGGKIQPYLNTLDIAMKDAEAARGLISALKKCAGNLKEK